MAVLSGVRLLSLAQNVPGPVAVARLVKEGATAIKIEPPSGDPLAIYAPAWYADLHAAIEVETIDLKTPGGRDRLPRHLAAADVLITSQRPSALDRLGLGIGDVARLAPHLRRVDIVGDTRAPEHPGHDLTYQAEAGLVRDRLPPTLLADMAGAERVVLAVLLVLRDGHGARRVVGLRDVVVDLAEPRARGASMPGGPLGGGIAAYGVYRTRDGIVAVAALEPHFRRRLYDLVGVVYDGPLGDAFAARSCAEWSALAVAYDLPLHVVSTDG